MELYLATAKPDTAAESSVLTVVTCSQLDNIATVLGVPGESPAYEQLTARLARAEICFAMGDMRLPEAIAWIDADVEALKRLGFKRELRNDERLVSSIWVSPLHDRRDVTLRLLVSIVSRLHREDKRLLVAAESNDRPMLQALQEAGFQLRPPSN